MQPCSAGRNSGFWSPMVRSGSDPKSDLSRRVPMLRVGMKSGGQHRDVETARRGVSTLLLVYRLPSPTYHLLPTTPWLVPRHLSLVTALMAGNSSGAGALGSAGRSGWSQALDRVPYSLREDSTSGRSQSRGDQETMRHSPTPRHYRVGAEKAIQNRRTAFAP